MKERRQIGTLSLSFLVTVFSLHIYSTDWVQLQLIEYSFNNKWYDKAIHRKIAFIRKESVFGRYRFEFGNTINTDWDDLIAAIVDKQISFLGNQWNEYRIFFAYDKTNYSYDKNHFGGIDTLFEKIRFFLGPKLVNSFPAWKRYFEYCESRKPYIAHIGFSDNDLDPAQGVLTNFNYTGGFPLDRNSRSIGADLGGRKPVVAISLRSWNLETRVKPENITIWISDNNKTFQKYTGQITFSRGFRTMTLDHLDIVSQFIKLHCNYEDDKYTFTEDLNNMLQIYGPPQTKHNWTSRY